MLGQVPKRLYTLEELRLNRIEASQLLSPKDYSLDDVRSKGQASGTQQHACPLSHLLIHLLHEHGWHAVVYSSQHPTAHAGKD